MSLRGFALQLIRPLCTPSREEEFLGQDRTRTRELASEVLLWVPPWQVPLYYHSCIVRRPSDMGMHIAVFFLVLDFADRAPRYGRRGL